MWWTPFGFWRRFRNGRVWKQFQIGEGQNDATDTDSIVNTLALVNALLLSLPVSIFASLQYGALDTFRQTALSCNGTLAAEKNEPLQYYNRQTDLLGKDLFLAIYLPVFSLLCVVFYYFCRPAPVKESVNVKLQLVQREDFSKWWGRGRFLVVLLLLTTFTSVFSFGFVMNLYYQNFFYAPVDFCSLLMSRQYFLNTSVLLLSVILFCVLYVIV